MSLRNRQYLVGQLDVIRPGPNYGPLDRLYPRNKLAVSIPGTVRVAPIQYRYGVWRGNGPLYTSTPYFSNNNDYSLSVVDAQARADSYWTSVGASSKIDYYTSSSNQIVAIQYLRPDGTWKDLGTSRLYQYKNEAWHTVRHATGIWCKYNDFNDYDVRFSFDLGVISQYWVCK